MLKSLTPNEIDKCVEGTENAADAVINLYKHTFTDWDKIVTVGQFPKTNLETAQYIISKITSLHKTGIGWLWINNGFGISKDVPVWQVEINPEAVLYKEV